jgi:hypothetical protein
MHTYMHVYTYINVHVIHINHRERGHQLAHPHQAFPYNGAYGNTCIHTYAKIYIQHTNTQAREIPTSAVRRMSNQKNQRNQTMMMAYDA